MHTMRLRKFRSNRDAGARARAHVNVRVHGLVYTHAVNVHVHNYITYFFTGLCPKRKKH